MARIQWIEERLLNWQRWRLTQGAGVLGYAAVNYANPTPEVREPYAEAPIPFNDIEASDTETAVQRLPIELRRTVFEHYVGRGTMSDHLKRLQVTRPTLYARIDLAHRMLANDFSAQREKRDRERQRVEALQASMRP